jgi:hypothetical protein
MEGRMTKPLQFHEADGMRLIVPILPTPPETAVPNFNGGQAEAHVRASNGTAIACTATITGAAEVTVDFLPWVFPPDDYALQVRATPPFIAWGTVLEDEVRVKRSLRPAP